MTARNLLFASLALLGVAAAPPSQSSSAATGDRPSYEFRGPVLNGMGIGSLADLKGKPVLVEFWGTR